MYQADIVVRNRGGNVGLAVEIKVSVRRSPEWAAKTRQYLADFGAMPDASFFLLATPDCFFFWTRPTNGTDNIPPSYSCDARAFLRPFFERSSLLPEKVHHDSFQLIVGAWLGDLMDGTDAAAVSDSDASWLVESGLLDEIRDGSIEYEVAV